jgi:tight adherence protein B
MLAPVLVFFGVAGLVIGIFFGATRFAAAMEGRKLARRLREVGHNPGLPDAALVMDRADGPLPRLDSLVTQTRVGSRLSRLIEQSGMRTTPSAVLVMSLCSGMLAALVAAYFLRHPLAPVAMAPIGMALPFAWLLNRRSARFKQFEEQFPEALDLLSRAIRAGHAFQTSLGMVGEELGAPVGPEFKKTFDRQNFGLPLRDAMDELADRVTLLDVRFFVTAVAIQRETGGNLAEILDNLAHVVRERFKIRRQVRVHTAHGRFTGYVLLVLPAALGVVLSFISPEHMKLLFQERMGQIMLIAAMVMQTVGFIWIRQVIKIEV